MSNVAVKWAQLYGECAVDSTEHLAGAQMGDIDGATRHKVLTSWHQKNFVDVTIIKPSFRPSQRVWRFELITNASPEMAFAH